MGNWRGTRFVYLCTPVPEIMCPTREKTVLGHDDSEDHAKGSIVVLAGRHEHLIHGDAAYPEGYSTVYFVLGHVLWLQSTKL